MQKSMQEVKTLGMRGTWANTGINSQRPGKYNEQDMDSNSRGAEKGAHETYKGANLVSK